MKYFTALLAIVAIFSSTLTASAANLQKFLLRGYIYNAEYHPLDSVEVKLEKNDTIPVPFKLLTGNSDTRINTSSGELRMMVESGIGNYCLTLYKDGYEPFVRNFTIGSVSEDLKYLSSLIMEKEIHHELGEVTVQATRVKMVMKGDTIVFDAAAFKLSEGSMLDALVRQLPGATLSTDGVIEVNGRKINELLVNGKDFFQGDPKVALQNLPAYTVKNLKVYDKADKDAYLTHSDARLDRKEEDENLVMDVVLKKEFDTGYLANAEGGYGTRDRYMGRAFGLGYTEKFRLAAFVNANNVGDSSQGGTSGQWRGATSQENGLTDRISAGLDYNYTQPEKIEASGSLTYSGLKDTNRSITASTNFFNTGDIFGRSDSYNRNRNHSIRTQHNVNWSLPNVHFSFRPVFSWTRTNSNTDSRSATFDTNPAESYRGEALDSIFRAGDPADISRSMLTYLRKMSAGKSDQISGSYSLSATIRPKTWKGMLILSSTGGLDNLNSDNRTLYDQGFGQNNPGIPARYDRFNSPDNHSNYIGGAMRYQRDIRNFGDTRTTNFSYRISSSYRHDHTDTNNPLYSSDALPDPLTPPSAVMVPGLLFDPANSPYTYERRNGVGGEVYLSYGNSPTTPGDSAVNSAINVAASLGYDHRHFDYRYLKPGITDQSVERNTDFLRPMVQFSYSSSNKVRNIHLLLYYQMTQNAPSMSALIDTRDSSDPLNIVTGNPDGLKNTTTHSINFNVMRFSRSRSNARLFAYGGWYVNTNSVAWARRYDPATGITVTRPENISGNWSASSGIDWASSFGSSRNITINATLHGSVTNSADYMAVNATPVRSSVLTQKYKPIISVAYTLKQGSTITLGMNTTIAHQHSARENFNNMTWYEYWPFVRAFIKLPAAFELNTQFNPYFRRGFTDNTMNTSEYVWDATLTKSFAKPAITLKLTAHDILGSAKHVYSNVNAQGRTETWQYTLPRYVMLTVGYRLDMKPRSGKTHNASRKRFYY